MKELGVRFGGAKGSRKMEGVMTNDPENKSATMPVAPQAEAAAAHFVQRTAKPHVWAEPMLTALRRSPGERCGVNPPVRSGCEVR